MDHSEAVRLMAAEKYLLGELAAESREQFEEHFFECPECARDVRAGAAFVEHSKVVLAGPVAVATHAVRRGQRGDRPGWLAWLRPAVVVPALAILMGVIGYQNLVTYPRLKGLGNEPRILASASLISANTRGAGKTVVTTHPGEQFLLFVDIPGDGESSSYVAELYGPNGKSEWSLAIPAEITKDTVPIRVPADHHGAGTYMLVVRGAGSTGEKGPEVGRYPFELQLRN